MDRGKAWGVNEFLLVQWRAPLASEAPEFVVAITFALRRRAGLALGSLLSARLNQGTLLVGMIPGVYAVSAGPLPPPLPMSGFQMQEILLTAAQSLLAVVLLATLQPEPGGSGAACSGGQIRRAGRLFGRRIVPVPVQLLQYAAG